MPFLSPLAPSLSPSLSPLSLPSSSLFLSPSLYCTRSSLFSKPLIFFPLSLSLSLSLIFPTSSLYFPSTVPLSPRQLLFSNFVRVIFSRILPRVERKFPPPDNFSASISHPFCSIPLSRPLIYSLFRSIEDVSIPPPLSLIPLYHRHHFLPSLLSVSAFVTNSPSFPPPTSPSPCLTAFSQAVFLRCTQSRSLTPRVLRIPRFVRTQMFTSLKKVRGSYPFIARVSTIQR